MRNNTLRANTAFTLLELMIVIAILSIIAIVAVSEYRDYAISAKIAAVIPSASSTRIKVEKEYIEGTTFGVTTETIVPNTDTDKPNGLYELTRGNYGCVQLEIDLDEVGLDSSSKRLILVWCPSIDQGAIEWRCGYNNTLSHGGYITFLPGECQNTLSSIRDTSL